MMVHIVHICTLLPNNNDVIICYRLLSNYQEKCRKTITKHFFHEFGFGCYAPLLWKQKITTMVTYFQSPRSLLYVHQVWMKYLHKL